MTNPKYTFETSEGVYVYSAHFENPDAIVVQSTRAALETMLSSLEMAGVEEGRYFEDYEIMPPELIHDHSDEEYSLELTKADLCLFLNFEVLNYV